jgi:hypothetical protein
MNRSTAGDTVVAEIERFLATEPGSELKTALPSGA